MFANWLQLIEKVVGFGLCVLILETLTKEKRRDGSSPPELLPSLDDLDCCGDCMRLKVVMEMRRSRSMLRIVEDPMLCNAVRGRNFINSKRTEDV